MERLTPAVLTGVPGAVRARRPWVVRSRVWVSCFGCSVRERSAESVVWELSAGSLELLSDQCGSSDQYVSGRRASVTCSYLGDLSLPHLPPDDKRYLGYVGRWSRVARAPEPLVTHSGHGEPAQLIPRHVLPGRP